MQAAGALRVRLARGADLGGRLRLLRAAEATQLRPAMLHFILQEVTLQCCLLCGAVLYIFCGVSLAACALLLPAAGAVGAGGARLLLAAQARRHRQKLRDELVGLVAEYCSSPETPPSSESPEDAHAEMVGTVSVSECYGARRSGWLHALAVAPRWRRRGVGRALVAAARQLAEGARLQSLEAATSQLQPEARALLHAAGWRARGAYHRRLLGSALTLRVAALGLELAAPGAHGA